MLHATGKQFVGAQMLDNGALLHHGDAMTTADIERWQRERLSSLEL